MPGHDIIVVGASAGGVEALISLVKGLPGDLPATLFIVLHISAHSRSIMPRLLSRAGSLEAIHPKDGELIEHGRIYIAPPDLHLLVKPGQIRLARGPKENGHRPAIDPLFRTAARFYGNRVVGVVLSGTLDDGTAGLWDVKRQGGIAIVQDPDEALFDGMPSSAIENVEVDHILSVAEIAATLVDLAHQPVAEKEATPVSVELERETDMAELKTETVHRDERLGEPSGFVCPDCGGALWELNDVDLLRFRCRTGHAFSVGSLLGLQSESVEEALFIALRALEEKAALTHRMARRAQKRNQNLSATRYQEQAHLAKQNAELIRQVLLDGKKSTDSEGSG